MTRPLSLLFLGVVLALGAVACAPRATPTAIADINAAPQRFVNRSVTVSGQVTTVQADPVGTTRGRYLLVDETDNAGIVVTSRSLPAPGEEFYITGTITQDPQNPMRAVMQEAERSAFASPTLQYVMWGSGALAVVLLIALLVTFVRPVRAESAPLVRPVMATPMPAPAPTPMRRHVVDDDETRAYDGGEETQAFSFWGVALRVVEGPDEGKTVPIGVSPFLVGRSGGRTNQLQLTDKTVSRSQATIRRHPKTGAFTIEHQGGQNETLVNGQPVDVAELREGDRIRAGATVLVLEQGARE
jgi:hypothetical protein